MIAIKTDHISPLTRALHHLGLFSPPFEMPAFCFAACRVPVAIACRVPLATACHVNVGNVATACHVLVATACRVNVATDPCFPAAAPAACRVPVPLHLRAWCGACQQPPAGLAGASLYAPAGSLPVRAPHPRGGQGGGDAHFGQRRW